MTATSYLRYAPHLGYLSPDQPLFRESVGNLDPADHAGFAAQNGFAGVFDPWMVSRPAEEIESLLAAVREHELACGSIAYAPFPVMFTPLFAAQGKTAWEEIHQHLERAIDLADRAGTKTIAIVLQGTPELDSVTQLGRAAEHLRKAGDLAEASSMMIGIEPMIALPDLMLGTTAQATEFFHKIAHPAVGMIFDTGHVQDMDGDILAAWKLARDHVCALQIADMPGRLEPGAGSLDLTRVLVDAVRDGKAQGLIELEHGWSETSASVEQSGISRLFEIDAAIRAAVENDQGSS